MPERAETAVMCMYVQHLMEKLFILHAVYQEEMGSTPEKGWFYAGFQENQNFFKKIKKRGWFFWNPVI